jgi:two-component system, NarL family, response regulator LiaR
MSNQRRIRVLIIDDHAMVRLGLSIFLKDFDDLELVGSASGGEEGLKLAGQTNPDVVLMDMMMPTMDGVTTTTLLRQMYPDVQVIALTSFGKEQLVKDAMKAGAIGFLFKDVTADELAQAIRAAVDSQPTLSGEALQALMSTSSDTLSDLPFTLTDTERKVLSLMKQGLKNTEIAEQLGVSRSTIKTHVSNIFSKMGVSNRVEAVTLALRHALIE